MGERIVRIPHSEINDTHKITKATTHAMEKQGLNIHINEVSKMDDDFKRGERILHVEKQGEMFFGICSNMSQERWNNIFKKGNKE